MLICVEIGAQRTTVTPATQFICPHRRKWSVYNMSLQIHNYEKKSSFKSFLPWIVLNSQWDWFLSYGKY